MGSISIPENYSKEVIKERVTTFSYAFNENLTFEYRYFFSES